MRSPRSRLTKAPPSSQRGDGNEETGTGGGPLRGDVRAASFLHHHVLRAAGSGAHLCSYVLMVHVRARVRAPRRSRLSPRDNNEGTAFVKYQHRASAAQWNHLFIGGIFPFFTLELQNSDEDGDKDGHVHGMKT